MGDETGPEADIAGALTDPQMLLAAITDYAIYQLDPQGNVRSWNAAAQRVKGYTAQQIIGRHFSCFYTPEDLAEGKPARALKMALSHGKFEDEGWRLRADGSRLWASVVINPVYDDAGAHYGFVKITRDVTRRHEDEEKLRQAHETIAQIRKMQSLGRVAAGIAHDFNNLLTSILTSADMIAARVDDERTMQGITAIQSAAEQGARLTSQLLAFARHQPLRPERFAMGACIADFLPVLRNTAGPSITITASVPEHDPIVEIDPAQFRSTLVNLVSNARDAISGSGNIEITARVKTVIPTIRKHEPVIGQYVAISVMDDGQGIDPAIGDMVFEPFFTTKPLYYGTGLGLSQVFGFCKQSGGNVAIANRPRGGAEVTLYLPIVDSRDSFDDVLVTRAREAELHTANILFVEDNRLVGSSAAQALMDLGYEVVWLEDAESALRTLAAEPDRFDVVVSDIVMPGLSGFDLAKKLKESHPGLPILLTSGYSNDIAHLASMGCEFIEKPYRLVDLAKTMDALLQGSGRNLH